MSQQVAMSEYSFSRSTPGRRRAAGKLIAVAAFLLVDQVMSVMQASDGELQHGPRLRGADVAVALADGAELAQASSDIVLAGGKLANIAPARRIAQETLRILKQNQRWALGYNFAAVPLAAP